MGLTIGSLFSGVGGLEIGLEWAGHGPVLWQVENNPFCREWLRWWWPDVTRHEDVVAVGAAELVPVDIICGGFPCQDVSGAGKGAGLAGARSGLWSQFARIVGELAPRWVVVENVTSGASRWLDAVVRELEELRYEALPLPLSADVVGAPHRRSRIFVVARRVLDPERGALGVEQQRLPPRREGGIPDEGQGEPGDVAAAVVNTQCLRDKGGAHPQPPQQKLSKGEAPHHPGEVLEYADLAGLAALWEREPHDGERAACGHHADGSSGPWPWPPGPGDLDGWRSYLAHGGPEPGLRRGTDGLPCGMDLSLWKALLQAFGNAAVPQCGEVAGEVINVVEGL